MKITVDMNTATLGEIEQFESDAGMGWDEFIDGKSGVRTTMALICLQERRKNPDYSMSDARLVRVSDIDTDEAVADPPTKRAPKKAAS